jgi:hypothetical protein
MKRMLLTLMALAVSSLANALAVDEKTFFKTFFSGAHLGMTIEECESYYFPDGAVPVARGALALGAIPLGGGTATARAIADGGSCWHSGAPDGERYLDFRHQDPTWRVLVCYRESDSKIVWVDYWRLDDQAFSPDEIRYLIDLNRGQGKLLLEPYDNGDEFVVTTPAQDKLERAPIVPKQP